MRGPGFLGMADRSGRRNLVVWSHHGVSPFAGWRTPTSSADDNAGGNQQTGSATWEGPANPAAPGAPRKPSVAGDGQSVQTLQPSGMHNWLLLTGCRHVGVAPALLLLGSETEVVAGDKHSRVSVTM